MASPPDRVAKGQINGRNQYRAIVSGYAREAQPRVEFRIFAKGRPEAWIEFTPAQTREAIRLLQDALAAAEQQARHDGCSFPEAAGRAPAGEASPHDGNTAAS